MFEVASQIIICLILAALLGWIIGYLMGKATCSDGSDCHEAPDSSHELHINNVKVGTQNVKIGTQPVLLSEPRPEGKDNLQLIKGVGVVLEKLLNETGFYHFDQIANLTEDEILWLDNSMSFPGRIKREDWVAQAKDLAEGKTTEYSERVKNGTV